jgi:hypothetical protein
MEIEGVQTVAHMVYFFWVLVKVLFLFGWWAQ